MKLELENVLKFDFYNEKMALYTDVVKEIMLHLVNFKGLEIIDEEEYNNKMKLFSNKFTELITLSKNIDYKYSNMMNQIFDLEFESDLPNRTIENYLEESKIRDFNKKVVKHEKRVNIFSKNVIELVHSMSLKKVFVTDMFLLKQMELDFESLYEKIEFIEDNMDNFKDTLQ